MHSAIQLKSNSLDGRTQMEAKRDDHDVTSDPKAQFSKTTPTGYAPPQGHYPLTQNDLLTNIYFKIIIFEKLRISRVFP